MSAAPSRAKCAGTDSVSTDLVPSSVSVMRVMRIRLMGRIVLVGVQELFKLRGVLYIGFHTDK